jgi:hypothetical protein
VPKAEQFVLPEGAREFYVKEVANLEHGMGFSKTEAVENAKIATLRNYGLNDKEHLIPYIHWQGESQGLELNQYDIPF